MEDWWIWSSPDLVNWTMRSVLKPEQTYIGKPFGANKEMPTDDKPFVDKYKQEGNSYN